MTNTTQQQVGAILETARAGRHKVNFLGDILDLFDQLTKAGVEYPELYPAMTQGLYDLAGDAYSDVLRVEQWLEAQVGKDDESSGETPEE